MKKLLLTVVGVAIVLIGFITVLCILPCNGSGCHRHGQKWEMMGDDKCPGGNEMGDGNEKCTVKVWTDADGKMHKQVMMMKGGDDGMCMGGNGKCSMDSGKCGMQGMGNGKCNMDGMDSGKCGMSGMGNGKCGMEGMGMGKCNMDGGMKMGCGMNMNGGCCCCCMMMMKMMQENGCCKDDGKCDMKKDTTSVKVKVRGKM